jgi:hypothetical protein
VLLNGRQFLILRTQRVSGITFVRYTQSPKLVKSNNSNVFGYKKTTGPE